ncbi:hypothetical protein PPROV_000400200 [Pycnococcus provasolii]|uniref:Ribosomal protein L1 n=1 Tax=Pycnococcus provasolii TaxID=41880 RepID=A0A830HHJ5_9CHLO|nr:hypothetical protein PPROV_000400200 [Pycnococcus provasolii]|mmetsp:Transcript_7404/g.19302  ORF Transcript_7404/g.19302 Transcript_7404/m.19302 type:complete len:367 (-) Transcript_7404:16-1116(-)
MAPPLVNASSPVSSSQVTSAVEALQKWLVGSSASGKGGKSKSSLFDDIDPALAHVHVLLSLHKTPLRNDGTPTPASSSKPRLIKIPHPILKWREASVCVIVRDDDGGRSTPTGAKPSGKAKQAKALVNAMEASAGITKVLGISKLRAKYKPYEAKRQLLNEYDVFLADDRILPLLPKLLGKHFFKRKKQPMPVNLVKQESKNAPKRHSRSQEGAPFREDWSKAVREVVEGTSVVLRAGSCVSVRAADAVNHTPKQASENILAVIESVLPHVGGFENLQGVFVKVAESVALPVYQAEGGAQPPKEEEENDDEDDDEEQEQEEVEEKKKKGAVESRKRRAVPGAHAAAAAAAADPPKKKRKQPKARLA